MVDPYVPAVRSSAWTLTAQGMLRRTRRYKMPRKPKADQIRMVDLLEDATFAKWINVVPKLKSAHVDAPPWQVMTQQTREGGWHRRVFSDYEEALDSLQGLVGVEVWDVTLGCRREQFPPPLLKIRTGRGIRRRRWTRYPETHFWCGYCRRPTRFIRGFVSHHALTGHWGQGDLDPGLRRCWVCGIPLGSIRRNWSVPIPGQ